MQINGTDWNGGMEWSGLMRLGATAGNSGKNRKMGLPTYTRIIVSTVGHCGTSPEALPAKSSLATLQNR
eukprot:scaffold74073_cov53-Prasinocladus_malaysianus.AAC.2